MSTVTAVRSLSARRAIGAALGLHHLAADDLELAGPGGDQVVLYLRHGQLIRAQYSEQAGPEAVNRVIGWQGEGAFTVEPVESFPEPDVSAPMVSILMEECRILDESRV